MHDQITQALNIPDDHTTAKDVADAATWAGPCHALREPTGRGNKPELFPTLHRPYPGPSPLHHGLTCSTMCATSAAPNSALRPSASSHSHSSTKVCVRDSDSRED